MNWPWTNKEKELQKLLKESENSFAVEIKDIDDFFDQIKNRKSSFWEDLWFNISYSSKEFTWKVYRWFKPCHQRIRKVIPNRWIDLPDLTLSINFEIIKSYVEEEMDNVSWEHHEKYIEVANWLRSSYEYITKGRLELQKQFDKELEIASSSSKKGIPYKERYGETNRIEALIDEKDKEVLIGLANYRQYLWS
jgi:hypothetical protein